MIYNPRVLELHTQAQLRAELVRIGAEFSSLDELIARGTFSVVQLRGLSLPLARLLYQELVMEGGVVALPARLDHVGAGTTDALLCATRYQLQHLLVRLRWQRSEELHLLADELEQALDNYLRAAPPPLTLGRVRFEWGQRTYLMGILNVTPDSFSGDGLIQPGDRPEDYVPRAVERARRLADQGADIIDIGGESTRPGAQPVDAATELGRVLPVIQALARETSLPLSIDTYKAEVARAALEAGAVLVNDVWGLQREPEMARVVAQAGAALVINHNWSGAMRPGAADPLGDIIIELRARVAAAREAGIGPERLIVDPGLGFGKTVEQNLEALDRLGELRVLGLPILIGPSRKGFISRVLNVPVDAREEGTAAAVSLGIARGADLVRVHDVARITRVARMVDAIARRK